jgi:hypothetical protein
MKNQSALLVVALIITGCSPDWHHYRLEVSSSQANLAHMSANQAEREITQVLRTHYPTRLVQVRQKIQADKDKDGVTVLTYIWKADFAKSSIADADWHFARLGTLGCAGTAKEALRFVDSTLPQKRMQLRSKFPGGHITTWESKLEDKGVACIDTELYITAPI